MSEAPIITAIAPWFGSKRTLAPEIVRELGEHPLIRELYGDPRWTWIEHRSRNQKNNEVSEVLIVKGGAPDRTADA